MSDTEELAELDLEELILKIQPLMNKTIEPGFTEDDDKELAMYLREYERRGLDMEYFTSGAGAPGNCVLM